jgi:hypothetical protein
MKNINYGKKEKNFREIVLSAVEKVLEILSKELRLYKKVIPIGSYRSDIIVEEEDTRESFIQAVQGLALILKPYFDEEMNSVYIDFDELCDMFYFEFYDKYKKIIENIMKIQTKHFTNSDDEQITKQDIKTIYIKYKIRKAKEIFRELNLLLKRNDYLKGEVYGEERDEVVEDEGDNE